MKYLLGKLNVGGKQFSYNDVIEKVPTGFPYDYYGGNVQWFGKTKEGFLLCIRKNKAEILDIYVDEDLLTDEGRKLLGLEPAKVVVKKEPPKENNEEHEKLVEQAKALGIKGVLENMKDATLQKKIAEAMATETKKPATETENAGEKAESSTTATQEKRDNDETKVQA